MLSFQLYPLPFVNGKVLPKWSLSSHFNLVITLNNGLATIFFSLSLQDLCYALSRSFLRCLPDKWASIMFWRWSHMKHYNQLLNSWLPEAWWELPWELVTSQEPFSDALMLIWRLPQQTRLWETVYLHCPPTPLAGFLLPPQIQDAWQWIYLPCQICPTSYVCSYPNQNRSKSFLNLTFSFPLTSPCSSQKDIKVCHFWKVT